MTSIALRKLSSGIASLANLLDNVWTITNDLTLSEWNFVQLRDDTKLGYDGSISPLRSFQISTSQLSLRMVFPPCSLIPLATRPNTFVFPIATDLIVVRPRASPQIQVHPLPHKSGITAVLSFAVPSFGTHLWTGDNLGLIVCTSGDGDQCEFQEVDQFRVQDDVSITSMLYFAIDSSVWIGYSMPGQLQQRDAIGRFALRTLTGLHEHLIHALVPHENLILTGGADGLISVIAAKEQSADVFLLSQQANEANAIIASNDVSEEEFLFEFSFGRFCFATRQGSPVIFKSFSKDLAISRSTFAFVLSPIFSCFCHELTFF